MQIGDTANYAVTFNGTTTTDTRSYLHGGELDESTWVVMDTESSHATYGDWVKAATQDGATPGSMLAHDFHGVTNGLDGNPDYSFATGANANVVDYTPRMISQTVTSHDALERLEADSPGVITDHAVYDLKGGDGSTIQADYHEDFIENTNSYAADPSYSGWFVLFGQFFDHGLDFVSKPGGGPTIQIALAVDDPLYGEIGPDGKPTTSITISRATPDTLVQADGQHVSVADMAGADGKFGTGDELISLGDDHMLGGGDDVRGKAFAQYVNHTSPYIDQSQTYGSNDQIDLLLREWVHDPNTGTYKPGASLLDGHTVATGYLSSVFTDKADFNADGQGLTDRTLPTLNELRAHLLATNRADITWEDVNDFRIRDASGQVALFDTDNDSGTPAVAVGSGEPLLLDMNPHFDGSVGSFTSGHISQTALNALNAAAGLTPGTIHFDSATHQITDGTPGGSGFALLIMRGWVDPATMQITAAGNALHAAVGEILLQSVGDHYIAGDGRANENIGLTTVHHVFHEDHNVQLVNLEATILGGMFDGNADKAKGYDWMVKVADSGAPAAPSGHVGTSVGSYTGVTYDFSGLTVTGGHYTADITNIRDGRGNIIRDSSWVAGAGQTEADRPALTIHGIYTDATGHVSWNQDMLFNATKLIVEMEYQHVAIDQYARFVTPDLPEFVTYDANINADISLEYAQAAFRFGHSQLRETIDAIETQGSDGSFDVTGNIVHYALSAAFLNPGQYAEIGPSAIALGMTHQVGNETDEFVTPALQQSLLGQPLDLAAINLARGRDLGIPTLNEVRQQLYDALVAERANTDGPQSAAHAKIQLDLLTPYNSWAEFGNSMIHPESLVNFIAAYSFDGNVDKAKAVLDADANDVDNDYFTADQAHDFMAGTLDTNGDFVVEGAGGFNQIDLWLGGLAESHVLGGILGPTFNAIFEDQMERLMDGDRFYYLYRLFLALPQITNLSGQVTNEQFKDLIERTTGVTHLNGDVMLYADSYIELGHKASSLAASKTEHKYADQLDSHHGDSSLAASQGVYSTGGNGTGGNGRLITVKDPEHAGQYLTFIRDFRPDSPIVNSNGNPTFGYNSHEVLAGTDFNDYLDTGDGDDTSYGGKGNDILVGNGGSDHLYGQDGNDTIYGAGGKAGADVADFLDGGDGDDYIYGGQNAGATEVLIGGKGNDHLYGEAGIDEMYGDDGDDVIDSGGDTDLVFGGAGNDELYGGEGPDELHGDTGDDLVSGGSGSDVLVGEQGDDVLFGGQGGGAAQGDSDELIGGSLGGDDNGFDIADYSDSSIKLNLAADLNQQNLQGTPAGVGFQPFNHLYMGIDGLVGTRYNDKAAVNTAIDPVTGQQVNPGGAGLIGDGNDNWLVGGSKDDVMDARGGNDIIVGDTISVSALNTFIRAYDAANGSGAQYATHFNDLEKSRPGFLLGDGKSEGTADQLVLSGIRKDYKVVGLDASGNVTEDSNLIYAYRITDNGHTNGGASDPYPDRAPSDGTDIVIGVEQVKFADGVRDISTLINHAPQGQPGFSSSDFNIVIAAGTTLTGTAGTLFDADNVSSGGAVSPTITWLDSENQALSTSLLNPVHTDSSGGLVMFTTSSPMTVTINERATYTDEGGNAETVTKTWNMVVGTIGNNNALNGTSSAISDAIFGLSGNDTLDGQGGDDVLSGGSGNDVINGGTGNDTIIGGSGTDSLSGGDGDDTITADSSDTNSGGLVDGGIGADTLLVTSDFNDAAGSNTRLVNIENVLLVGNVDLNLDQQTEAFTITGSSSGNTITSGSGADVIDGAGGSDSIAGGGGNDTIIGGTGNDTVIGGAGADSMDGGTGTDTLSYARSAAVTVNLGTPAASGGDAAGDSFSNFENLVGSSNADTLTGDGNANAIDGGSGNDVINGGGGDDILTGGFGRDTMTGGSGNDSFDFNAMGETGVGSASRDVITAFEGAGSAGGDVIDLSGIPGTFAFIGIAAFAASNVNQLRYQHIDTDGVGGVDSTLIQLDNDTDTGAEAEILLTGLYTFVAGDFVL